MKIRHTRPSLAAMMVAMTIVSAPAQQTRVQLSTTNNATIKSNGHGSITGSVVNTMFGQVINYLGVLADANAWTGTNNFTGPLLLNGLPIVQSIKQYGLICDGTMNDDANFTTAMSSLVAANFIGTIVFPGPDLCLVNASAHTMPPGMSMLGTNGGGLKLSGSVTGDTFRWTSNNTGVSVQNMTVDVNSSIPVGGKFGLFLFSAMLDNTGVTDLTFSNNRIINAGQSATTAGGLDLVKGYGLTRPFIQGNVFAFNGSSPNHNQTVNLGTPTQPITDLIFTENQNINSGFGMFGASGTFVITSNLFRNVGFGAAIATEPLNGAVDSAFKSGVIASNTVDGTPAALDWLGTAVRGIENGFAGVTIGPNSVQNTCGPSIAFFGPDNQIINNNLKNPGTCNVDVYYNSAILAISNPNNNTATGFVSGNRSAGGDYGFAAAASAQFNIALGINDFHGNLGADQISTNSKGVYYSSPSSSNLLINPCGAVDQRNGTGTSASGYGPDGWRAAHTLGAFTLQTFTTPFGTCFTGVQAAVIITETPGVNDLYHFYQPVTVDAARNIGWGFNLGIPLNMSFCAKITGVTPPFTTSVYLQNIAAVTSWVQPFVYSVSVGLKQCYTFQVTPDFLLGIGIVPSDTAFRFGVNIGSGANKLTSTTGSSVAGLFFGASADQQIIAQAPGTAITISDARLFAGSSDNGFLAPSPAVQLEQTQRYFRSSFPIGIAPAQNAGLTGASCTIAPVNSAFPNIRIPFDRPMVTAPTITTFNPSVANANWRNVTAGADVVATTAPDGTSTTGFTLSASAGAATAGNESCIHWTAEAGPT